MPSGGDQPGAARVAAATYDAASDAYLRPALSFWDRFGKETVDRLGPKRESRVLDLCCGAGASALAAAHAVGPSGSVLGVDVSQRLLDTAAARARASGITNLELRNADATRLAEPDGSFDVVVCVFGVFFAADPAAFVEEMVRLVRPGGALAVTTWGEGWAEPLSGVFWEEVGALRPDLYRTFSPWDELTSADSVVQLLRAGGASHATATYVAGRQPVDGPACCWDVVEGTGYRGTLEAMAPTAQAALRAAVTSRLEGVGELRTDVVFGTATRVA